MNLRVIQKYLGRARLETTMAYLQHVLPSGFMKIRGYGFANPTSSVFLETVKALIERGTRTQSVLVCIPMRSVGTRWLTNGRL